MSRQPIARNADLARLADEGYALEVDLEGVLLVKYVPYVTPACEVKRGLILVRLKTAGSIDDIVGFPDHTVFFAGDLPCDDRGKPLTKIVIGSQRTQLTPRLTYDHQFSSKPGPSGYPSMYAQIRRSKRSEGRFEGQFGSPPVRPRSAITSVVACRSLRRAQTTITSGTSRWPT